MVSRAKSNHWSDNYAFSIYGSNIDTEENHGGFLTSPEELLTMARPA